MIKFIYSSKLIHDEELSVSNVLEIKDKLRKKPPFNCSGYMITASDNPNDMLDIVSIPVLNLYRGPRRTVKVYGLAADREGAIRVLERMTEECMKTRGDCNLREFLA